MKRFHLTITLCLIALATMAQEGTQGLSLQLGFASPTLRLNQPAETGIDKGKLTTTALNGLRIGLAYEATYLKGFGNTIGLNYTYAVNLGKWESIGAYDYPKIKDRVEVHTLEVCVDWQYKFEIAKDTYIILYSGPTIQCHLAMYDTEFRQTAANNDPTQKRISSFDYSDEEMNKDYNRLNVTWGIGAGFQYSRYFIRGGYDFGLMNPYRMDNFNKMGYADRNTRGRMDQWQIKLGVFLWQN